MTPDPIATLLIVDDEPAQMKVLHETLETEGYSATGFTSATAALAALREHAFDLVLVDLMMPEMGGVAFLHAAFEIDPALAGVVMTGHGAVETAVQAMRAGAHDYILKPFGLKAILPVLERSLALRRVRTENMELHQAVGMYELTRVLGLTSGFDTVLRNVADTALTQSGVRGITVWLAEGNEGGELFVAAARGENAEAALGMRVGFSEGLREWLACHHEPDQLIKSALAAPLGGILGNVAIAMMAGGNFVGILNFSFGHIVRPVTGAQLKALNILAGAAASALEAASLLGKVRSADKQYHRLTENAADIILRYDLRPAPCLAYVNQAVTVVTGYSPAEYYADADLIFRIVHPDDRGLMEAMLRGERPSGSTAGIRCLHRNGNLVWIELRAMPVQDQDDRLAGVEAIARDVTDRKQIEERLNEGTMELRRSLVEQTALLKEVHHRVKNNLQIICSLMSMQIASNDSLSQPLNDAYSRVVSMSLIHEQIYESETMADLDFGLYIDALSGRLFERYCVDPYRIQLDLSVEPIRLGVDQAIPCGLILNELISNSLRHAFGDGRKGVIRISLRQAGNDRVEIAVADNGVGLPLGFSLEGCKTLGLQVAGTLIRQLSADFSMTSKGGTAFRFGWKLPERENIPAPAVLSNLSEAVRRDDDFSGALTPDKWSTAVR